MRRWQLDRRVICVRRYSLLWQSEICGNKSQCRIRLLPGYLFIHRFSASLPLPQSTSYLFVGISRHAAIFRRFLVLFQFFWRNYNQANKLLGFLESPTLFIWNSGILYMLAFPCCCPLRDNINSRNVSEKQQRAEKKTLDIISSMFLRVWGWIPKDDSMKYI